MTSAHAINIACHVLAGLCALGFGFVILALQKGTATHRRLGIQYCYLTGLVCFFAATGLVVFRFLPLFAVITLLVSYQLISGWHSAQTKQRGPNRFDAALSIVTLAGAAILWVVLQNRTLEAPAVTYATLGTLVFVMSYDLLRWLFPKHWHQTMWLYEHVYKMLASLFGMLSALVGNVVRAGQPWSQLAPSALGVLVILYFFYQLNRANRRPQSLERTDISVG